MSAQARYEGACLAIDTDPGAGWVAALGADVKVVAPDEAVQTLAAWADAPDPGPLAVATMPVALPAGWAARLAALAGPSVATVSALPVTDGRAGEPVPVDDVPAPSLDQAQPPVVLLTRGAAQLLAGDLPAETDAEAWIAAFSRAAAARGLLNLVAADVPAAPLVPVPSPHPDGGDDPFAGALRRHRRRVDGLSVTIDARSLNTAGSGTQVHTLELIATVARRARVRVMLPPDPSAPAQAALERIAGLELRTYDELAHGAEPTDVVHRPFQVYDPHDIELLRRLGHRLVVTHQDQLLFRTPSYFADEDAWRNYRGVSRLVLSWAARVVFFTAHARDEALRDGVVDPEQAAVVPIGTRRVVTASDAPPARPDGDWSSVGDAPFLLALGTDLGHKNRPFAIRVLAELRARHGFAGGLVLAGPHVEHGSSRAQEDRLLADGPPVLRLGEVSDGERRWLLEHCAAVVFASSDEGFGLVPFEATDAGRPCAFAPVGPAPELFGRDAALLVPWDPAASADRLAALLDDPVARAAHVEALRAAGAALTWEAAGDALMAVYEQAADSPPRAVLRITADAAEREQRLATIYERDAELRASLGEDALSLVGPGGLLPPDMRRPLLAAAGRPWSRRPLFAVLRALYRLGRGSGA